MKKIILLFLSVTLLLSACSGGASMSASGAQAWLDQPVNGAVLPLGVFPLKAHARHASGSGITRIEFLVNGVPVGAVDTDAAAPLVYGEVNWNASVPGEYSLSARAYASDGVSESASVKVCVSKEAKEPFISPTGDCGVLGLTAAPTRPDLTETLPPTLTPIPPTFTPIPPTSTPIPPTFTPIPPTSTPIPPTATRIPPTFTPVPPTSTSVPVDKTPPLVYISSISPSVLYYGQGCGYKEGLLIVEAYVYDAESGVDSVYLIYGFTGAGAEGIFVEMYPIGGHYYRVEVDIGSQAYTFYQGASGSISIFVTGNDTAGNSAGADGGEVPLFTCPG